MALSATAVSDAKGKEKSYKLADTGGLYLLVNPQGHRYWRFNYRFEGKFKTLAFGVFPDVSLADGPHADGGQRRSTPTHCTAFLRPGPSRAC